MFKVRLLLLVTVVSMTTEWSEMVWTSEWVDLNTSCKKLAGRGRS